MWQQEGAWTQQVSSGKWPSGGETHYHFKAEEWPNEKQTCALELWGSWQISHSKCKRRPDCSSGVTAALKNGQTAPHTLWLHGKMVCWSDTTCLEKWSEAVGKKWCHSTSRAHLPLCRHKKSSREQKPKANLGGWWVKGVGAVIDVLLWLVTYKGCDLWLVLIGGEKVWPGNRKFSNFHLFLQGGTSGSISYLGIYTHWYSLKDVSPGKYL